MYIYNLIAYNIIVIIPINYSTRREIEARLNL